jgi:PPOX class probable F420-dependent enzyme
MRLMLNPPRSLEPQEIAVLLGSDVPAHLATLDSQGFPHVTPLWFIWEDDAFHLTSFSDRLHVRRLERDPRASICIDIEGPQREDGERPNQQLRAVGRAETFPDQDGTWTQRMTAKYITGTARERRTTEHRTVIRLRRIRMVAVASV